LPEYFTSSTTLLHQHATDRTIGIMKLRKHYWNLTNMECQWKTFVCTLWL